MKKYELSDIANQFTKQLSKGALLTVKGGNNINTMTIGWGFVGIMWSKPTVIAAVRKSRYTYELLKEAKDFTVSFPSDNELKNELAICGSKSGRDMDKYKEAGLSIMPAYHVQSPIIKECNFFIEAKISYIQDMDRALFTDHDFNKFYPDEDDHVFYYGEIMDIYGSEN